jgi:hypothetical protein|tara:strand:+ start:416 stop:565 length:150 start_codon:yes stop_codon:yes gene_type:complete
MKTKKLTGFQEYYKAPIKQTKNSIVMPCIAGFALRLMHFTANGWQFLTH